MTDKRQAHCWKDQGEHIEETKGYDAFMEFTYVKSKSATCMLMEGHSGPHQFTPDSEIGVSFKTGRHSRHDRSRS